MTTVLLYLLIPITLGATAIILGLGIYSLAKGGSFAKQYSNKLMRLRVAAQAVAIIMLMLLVFLLERGN